MKNKKTTVVRAAAIALAGLCLTAGAALAAGEGTQSDPLVTLSYLTQTVTPTILGQVDDGAVAYEQQLVDRLDAAIQDYTTRMDGALEGMDAQEHNTVYAVVTLKKDQQLKMAVGCEVMLRIGTARCITPSSPGLIDTTDGTALNNEQDLVINHLYMATIAERSIKATANTTKVLVRGGYSVE